MRKRKYEHITVTLCDDWHWLPIRQRITYKLCTIVYKCLLGAAPSYLTEMCVPVAVSTGRRCLRSAAHSTPLPWWLPVLSDIELPALRRKAATDKLVEKIVKYDSLSIQPDILSPPLLRLTSRKPLWLDLQPVDIKSRWRHNWKSATGFRPPSATMVSAEPFSHGTGTLWCLKKEMATYRHWSVSLRWDPENVSHCWILSPDKTEWRFISATLCGWRHCFVADQLWFMTRIREEEEAACGDVMVPRTRTRMYGSRSFAVSGPRVWNDLPPALHSSSSTLGQFQSRLKTTLFRLTYGMWLGAFVTV